VFNVRTEPVGAAGTVLLQGVQVNVSVNGIGFLLSQYMYFGVA
jgi:hypothetical protein